MKNPSATRGRFLRGHQQVLVAILATLTCFLLSACQKEGDVAPAAAPTQPSPAIKQPSPTGKKANAPAEKLAPPEPPPPDLFTRGRSITFELGSALIGQIPEKFSRAGLQSRKIALTAFSNKKELWLAVDDHAPRRARSTHFVISDLLNEDVELAPGSHWLTAFEWGAEESERLQLAAFFVDVEPASLPRTPGCVLFTPELTKNGSEASKEIRFLAIPLVAGIDSIEYQATGDALRSRGDAAVGTEIILEKPPSGDVRLSARCLSGEEQIASDEQMVTVNPDASVAGSAR